MNIHNQIKNYILENQFKIIYEDDKVDIVNYQNMGHFDDNKVIVYYDKGIIEIKGKNLIIKKLLKDEVLIKGSIEKIEFR